MLTVSTQWKVQQQTQPEGCVMSKDVKLPQAGEWWRYHGNIYYCCGTSSDGDFVFQNNSNGLDLATADEFGDKPSGDRWHHEPGRTGFDKPAVEKKLPQAGKWPKYYLGKHWRESTIYIRRHANNEVFVVMLDGTEEEWPSWDDEDDACVDSGDYWEISEFRAELLSPKSLVVEEKWPKYYVSNNWSPGVAYLRRNADGTTMLVNSDGDMRECPAWDGADDKAVSAGVYYEVSPVEARSRVKIGSRSQSSEDSGVKQPV